MRTANQFTYHNDAARTDEIRNTFENEFNYFRALDLRFRPPSSRRTRLVPEGHVRCTELRELVVF